MRRSLIFFMGLAVLLAAACGAMADGSPMALVPEASHHLGKITREGTYEHSFQIMNGGSSALEIQKVVVG